jgi:hypothetical protein
MICLVRRWWKFKSRIQKVAWIYWGNKQRELRLFGSRAIVYDLCAPPFIPGVPTDWQDVRWRRQGSAEYKHAARMHALTKLARAHAEAGRPDQCEALNRQIKAFRK